jgi:hypothetical protein
VTKSNHTFMKPFEPFEPSEEAIKNELQEMDCVDRFIFGFLAIFLLAATIAFIASR